MRWLRAYSIRAKLIAIVMLTTVPALLVAGLALGVFEAVNARRTLRAELQAMADVIGTNSTAALAFGDRKTGQEILSALIAQPAVVLACLYDPGPALFARYRPRDDGGECPARPAQLGGRFEASRFVLWQPVWLQGEPAGTIGVIAHLGQVHGRLWRFSGVLLLILTAASLGALAFAAWLQRLVSGPIVELGNTARQVSLGNDYTLRAPKQSEDEVGVAVDAFNHMLRRIEVSDAALRDAEERSRNHARLLRSILDNMGEGLVVVDEQGHFTLWNPAASRIVGRGPADLQPHEWPSHFHLSDDEAGPAMRTEDLPLVRALQGELVNDREIHVRPPGGPGLWISATARPLRDEAGSLRGALVVFRDVSERKRAEAELRALNATLEERVAERTAAAETRAQELRRSNQELEQFANVASHDLQEPLRAVASYTQLIRDRLQHQADAESNLYMEHVVSAVVRMRSLIQDLLDYARIGRRPLQIVSADSGAILDATLADLSPALKESAAVVTHGPLPVIQADPIQLGRLLQNLISNALKFRRDAAPEIAVSAESGEGYWRFSVRDNGIGIDPRHHDRIFVIFQRLHGRARPGTGIGLAICRKIIERHGGRIWVESEPGNGATFFFTLPMRKATDA